MLILTRKPGESVYIGDDIRITIVEIKGHQIRVGIDAPKDFRIYREEIYVQIMEENRLAARESSAGDIGAFDQWKPGAGASNPARKMGIAGIKAKPVSGSEKEFRSEQSEVAPEVVVRKKKSQESDD